MPDATPRPPAPTQPGWRRMVAVATTPPYSWYLAGEVADTLGVWMQRLALGWLVWELTRSPAWLGILSFLKFAPTIVLGLIGGVLADRMSRRTLVIGMQMTALFKAVIITLLLWTGGLSIAILVAIELVIGTAIALSQAAGRSLVNDLVPADRLSSAIALDSVVFNVSTLVGPAVAGAVMLAFDMTICFAVITVLTLVVSAIGLLQRQNVRA